MVVPADAIPEFVEVDLTGLDIGDSVHISAVTLPEGVRPTITAATSPSPRSPARLPCCRRPRKAPPPLPRKAPRRAGRRRGRAAEAMPKAARARPRQGQGRAQKPRQEAALSARLERGLPDAAHRGSRQSRPALCRQPAQYRLHGGGRDPPPPSLLALARALRGRDFGGRARRREGAAPEARHLHERVRPLGRRRRCASTSSRRPTSW